MRVNIVAEITSGKPITIKANQSTIFLQNTNELTFENMCARIQDIINYEKEHGKNFFFEDAADNIIV